MLDVTLVDVSVALRPVTKNRLATIRKNPWEDAPANDGFYGRRTVPPGTPAQLRARPAMARLAAQRRDVIPTNVVRAVPSNSCQQWRRRLNAEPHAQRDRPCLTWPPCFDSAGRRTRSWQPLRAASSRLAVQSIAVHSTVFAAVPLGQGLAGVPYAVAG